MKTKLWKCQVTRDSRLQ